MGKPYDVIVVGARCAGSPTGMLLAHKGYQVLIVDRASFPSDTISTHVVHPMGAAALARWGLLDRLAATGCPPIHTYAFDFGPFTLSGSPGTLADPVAYCPRRTVLDKLLVDAAVEAGAEVREGFTVEEVVLEDGRVAGIKGHVKGGHVLEERARVLIGADGRHSMVAKAVRPNHYNEKPPLLSAYYSFTCQLATLAPPPVEMQRLFGAISRNQEHMHSFVQMNAGTISPAQFFTPDNIGRIMGGAEMSG